MNRASTLVMAGADHVRLFEHLFPGDGKEAAAVLACTRVQGGHLKLLVREVALVPHEDCARSSIRITWPADVLDVWQERAEIEGLSLILVHSHPGGYLGFSDTDDEADQGVMPYLFPFGRPDAGEGLWHGSAVMTPDGAMRARLYDRANTSCPVDLVAVYGDDIRFFWGDQTSSGPRPMAFTEEMRDELKKLSIAVIGISGTGSIVAEQLLRLGVGKLIVIDHDKVEHRNLNRILNTTLQDARDGRAKVEVFKASAALSHPDTEVVACAKRLGDTEAIELAAQADILFGCVDSYDGRHLADRLATCAIQPLFDVGVLIPVRHPPRGAIISNICGRVDYVQPLGSTLSDRGVYTPALLAAEYLREVDPEAHAGQVGEGYMPGTQEQAPSVITVNMIAASFAVQEFVARAYPYRSEPSQQYARIEFDLVDGELTVLSEDTFVAVRSSDYATGLGSPLLGLPALEDLRCTS
ncbi:ThiF family adenylyltransferase [Novilysobacter spongiicola]|uniref:JAB domain-containing protein n=1 Tax=Lysobacter spongiicola DSM 21749 TaxID=1122188 RepID=A0A1T4RG65_9GAMM|nr:ThiF family adenylyltransferase [Lysobacter spongiicola]SKA14877.1 JAB domain-containing protein [Lysobacter spongiicola DSM 21749]